MRLTVPVLVLLLAAPLAPPPARLSAQAPATGVRLPALFTDHLVVQRDRPVVVWGWADPGGEVRVSLAGYAARAVADGRGEWRVKLPALPAGGPHELTVAGATTRTLRDVLVGDVWVASGQSNMEWQLRNSDRAAEEIAAAHHPRIRLFTVRKDVSDVPLADVQSDGWHPTTPQTAEQFSAVAYFFGRQLHRELGVPIGLIHTSWGGTVAEAWTSAEALRALPDFAEAVQRIQPGSISLQRQAELTRGFQRDMTAWEARVREADAGYGAGGSWAAPGHDHSGWRTIEIPSAWESGTLPGFDGVVWLRREVELPATWAGGEATLRLGRIEDSDSAWVNGTWVGASGSPGADRAYRVPAGVLRPGRNLIAVRVLELQGARGGLVGPAADLRLEPRGGAAIPLAGAWRFRETVDLRSFPRPPARPGLHNRPAALYNAMIHPLTPFPVKGAIWYQGESNAGRAAQYRTLFPALIRDWRARWGQPELPFLFVQLANYMDRQPDPNAPSAWAALREAQSMTLTLPHTGMATAIDIGEADDIHPRNKQDVGRRLALAALGQVYGRNVVHSGPTLRETRREGATVRLLFDQVGGGLAARGGRLAGFAVAGPDRQFRWADARIDGGSVVLSHPDVPNPVAVRYGWGDNPDATLFNREGLPAAPFRTDAWPLDP